MSLAKWKTNRTSVIVFATTIAIAAGLTACNKGFSTNDKKSNVRVNANIPASTVTTQVQTPDGVFVPVLVDLAMAQDQNVKAIVNDPKNKNQVRQTTTVGFAIPELDTGGKPATNAVLYANITVIGVDNQSAATEVMLNNSQIALVPSADGLLHIEGYWTIDRGPNLPPYYLVLQSVVKDNGSMNFNLQGNILASVNNQGAQIIASFDKPLCDVVNNPTAWINAFFADGGFTFGECPAVGP